MASNHLPFGNYSFQDCVRSQPQHPPLVRLVGSDPTTSPLSGVCSTNWAIDANASRLTTWQENLQLERDLSLTLWLGDFSLYPTVLDLSRVTTLIPTSYVADSAKLAALLYTFM